jgi:hypothetical protein
MSLEVVDFSLLKLMGVSVQPVDSLQQLVGIFDLIFDERPQLLEQ